MTAVQSQISADGSGTGSTTTSLAVTAITAGNVVRGGFMYSAGAQATISSIVCGSDTLAVQDHFYDTGNTNGFCSFAKANCAGGGTTLTVTTAGSCTFRRLMMTEESGAGTTIDQHTGQLQLGITPPTSSGNITPSQTGDYLYGCCCMSTGGAYTLTVGAGYTIRNNVSGNCSMADEIRFPYSSVSPIAATFGGSTTVDFITCIIAVSPSGGGGGPSCKKGSSMLLGIGCGIWAAKKLEENPLLIRRRLILPPWHKGR